jgi:DNA-binding XRE family transcriptional regulator
MLTPNRRYGTPTAGQRAANKKGLAQCVQTIAEPKNTRAKASRAARMSERNQFGRRNITLACRCELAEKLAEALWPKAKENRLAGNKAGGKSKVKLSSILTETIDTREQAAKEAGVSHGSMADFKSKGWTQERIGEVLGVARTTVELWLASRTNDRAVNASTPKDCRIKLSKERIGEVLGVAQQTLSRWLDIPNTRSGNASTPKDCRIKLSTLPTPHARHDAPTLAQRTPLASLVGEVRTMSVSRFSWDDTDRAGCRAALSGFSQKF